MCNRKILTDLVVLGTLHELVYRQVEPVQKLIVLLSYHDPGTLEGTRHIWVTIYALQISDNGVTDRHETIMNLGIMMIENR